MDKSSGSGVPISAGKILSGVFSATLTILLSGLGLFGSAGTFDYPEAWVYLLAFTLWMVFGSIWLIKCHPELYNRRVVSGPTAEDSLIQKFLAIGILTGIFAMFVLPGLDRRYGWSHVDGPVTLFGLIGAMAGLLFIARVAGYNEFMAAKITVESTQTVITTGPYAVVRHPMYSGCLLWMACTPVALGSWCAMVVVVPLFGLLVGRLVDEERFLRAHLNGYSEYCTKVRSRLIPCIV
jgi:protein-S-isoprenylcysteine O-methyltransferase Ste14